MAEPTKRTPVQIDPQAIADIEEQMAQLPHMRKMMEAAKALGEDTTQMEDYLDLAERMSAEMLKRFKPASPKTK